MFFEERNLQDKIESNEKKIKGLEQLVEGLDRDTKELFNEIQLSPDEIHQFISNKKNFTDSEWEQLQEQRKSADEKVKRELSAVTDPRIVKETMASSKNIQRHWLHVR